MDIKFQMTLIIQDPVTFDYIDITKDITRTDIELIPDVPYELDKKDITSYFSIDIKRYCSNNGIKESDLFIDGYEVKSKTEGVYVYFKTDDIDVFTFTPSLMAILEYNLEAPKLFATQLDDSTIKWHWENDGNSHYLMDEKDNIIAHLPVESNYYIETELDTNRTYYRFLVSHNESEVSSKSIECSITLLESKKESVYSKFTVRDFDEQYKNYNTEYSSRLAAFASGIGDNNDCKIYKPDNTNFAKRFKLVNKIYGIRANSDTRYRTIKFGYRYKLMGKVPKLTYDGSCRVKISAIEIQREPIQPYHDVGDRIVSTRTLEYRFDNSTHVADIYFASILPELEYNYDKRYRFTVEVIDAVGELKIYSFANGCYHFKKTDKVIFDENGFFDHKFSIEALPIIKMIDYIEYYPSLNIDPLIGAINGDFEVREDGKKDMVTNMVAFDAPPNVIDKKYYCVIENIEPNEAYVKYKFFHQVEDEDYSEQNGDQITFYSDAIIADTTEYRDYIAQTEEGEFVIDDNRKHVYEYMITDINVNPKQYKRFELDIVTNTNDAAVVESTKNLEVIDDKINSYVRATVRGIQSAVAKWNPFIHNGYYYINQDEYFLYSRCTVDGDNKILQEVYYKNVVTVKVSIEVYEDVGEFKEYFINLNDRDSLLINPSLFQFIDGKIAPKPYNIPSDYYEDYYEVYEYYTKPIIFDRRPTSIDSITWDEFATGGNIIEAYLVSLNNVVGEWTEPYPLISGQPIEQDKIHLSKINRIKFLMKPARRPYLRRRDFIINSEHDWKNNKDHFLSTNLYYEEEILKPFSENTDGIFISEVLDLGDTSDPIKNRAIYHDMKYDGKIDFYIQQADTESELKENLNNSTWVAIQDRVQVKGIKRFLRYKIVLRKRCRLYSLLLRLARYEYTDMPLLEKFPMFNNVSISATYNPSVSTKVYEHTLNYKLEHSAIKYTLINDLEEYFINYSNAQGFSIDKIKEYKIVPYGANQKSFDVSYSNLLSNDPVKIYSKNTLIDYDLLENNQTGVKFPVVNNTVVVAPIPQQYCPVILLEENIKNPYRQVFFNDEHFNYCLENTEEFISDGFQTIYLQNTDIDEKSMKISINNIECDTYSVQNNIVIFENKVKKDSVINISYKLKNSYCVNYDYEEDKAIIEINKSIEVSLEYVTIFFETNKTSALRELRNICLNPIYNTLYNGYIYISDFQTMPTSVELYPETEYMFANGKDECNILIKVKDKNNNPVENFSVNIITAKGKIKKTSEKTDINGIIKCIYTTPVDNCVDEIKAITSNNLKSKCYIINRKL